MTERRQSVAPCLILFGRPKPDQAPGDSGESPGVLATGKEFGASLAHQFIAFTLAHGRDTGFDLIGAIRRQILSAESLLADGGACADAIAVWEGHTVAEIATRAKEFKDRMAISPHPEQWVWLGVLPVSKTNHQS